MKRRLVVFLISFALLAPSSLLAQGRRQGGGNRGQGGAQGNGTQLRQRIHTPGTGQTGTQAVRKQDRKRDGTGTNCPNTTATPKQSTKTSK